MSPKLYTAAVLLLLIGGIIYWQQTIVHDQKMRYYATRWTDSLFTSLPPGLDTNLQVRGPGNKKMTFKDYAPALFNQESFLYLDSGTWRVKPIYRKVDYDDIKVSRQERLDYFCSLLNNANRYIDRVIVYKKDRRLIGLKKGAIAFQMPVELGSNPVGHKESEGDGRTPEGSYLLYAKAPRDLYYYAFNVSYPNAADQKLADERHVNPGGSILIHGTRTGLKKTRDWTAGCIAVVNSDMDTLIKYVSAGTPVDIRK